MESGTLYVVATPLGNLGDLSQRAVETLASVDLIAAEDTRHSAKLLSAMGIGRPLIALHEHNETSISARILERLGAGESIALISDAGTPLISDPGYPLVSAARRQGCKIVPIPGPSAIICALSAAGLPTDRFLFEGFPPRTAPARRRRFEQLAEFPATLVFYESSHRLAESLADMAATFGTERRAVLARELTKLHETFLDAPLAGLLERVQQDPNQQRGEMVILVAGAPERNPAADESPIAIDRLLALLLRDLSVKRAAEIVAEATGRRRNEIYRRALEIKDHGASRATPQG
ncbi:MAG: 16S rRNA (cytidine(1402)-2'-O)-methyltransferase [Gammaproteobacteria bacterium]|nr:16S rRNA (cytidine(1402)-2'-O)-methyltransferase [Gammaproteobacteria bacterium]MBU1653875.1 16S rRNA (cytidine(1402)-2'-O)-methyltransferase [Gammaproteobacteria bacterium]MBU1962587.1 16S rRNA (cytidine(1402)-2'-O)-methyltransferase [Gammaproteobacteria bacterium]